VASEQVAGTASISYGYDADGLLTSAGSLALHRDAASGFITSATLGRLSESRTYSQYGEEQTYSVSSG